MEALISHIKSKACKFSILNFNYLLCSYQFQGHKSVHLALSNNMQLQIISYIKLWHSWTITNWTMVLHRTFMLQFLFLSTYYCSTLETIFLLNMSLVSFLLQHALDILSMIKLQESLHLFRHIFGLNAEGKYTDTKVYFIPGNHGIGYASINSHKPEVLWHAYCCNISSWFVELQIRYKNCALSSYISR